MLASVFLTIISMKSLKIANEFETFGVRSIANVSFTQQSFHLPQWPCDMCVTVDELMNHGIATIELVKYPKQKCVKCLAKLRNHTVNLISPW